MTNAGMFKNKLLITQFNSCHNASNYCQLKEAVY